MPSSPLVSSHSAPSLDHQIRSFRHLVLVLAVLGLAALTLATRSIRSDSAATTLQIAELRSDLAWNAKIAREVHEENQRLKGECMALAIYAKALEAENVELAREAGEQADSHDSPDADDESNFSQTPRKKLRM